MRWPDVHASERAQVNHALTTLDLNENHIGGEGARALGHGLEVPIAAEPTAMDGDVSLDLCSGESHTDHSAHAEK